MWQRLLPAQKRIWLFLAILVLFANRESAKAEELFAGAAKADITPPTGFPMWGYASRHDAPSQGVLDRLTARAVVLGIGKSKTAIVSLDLGRPPTRQSFAIIRKSLQSKAGIQHLFLVASHTHHGPVLEMDNWPTKKNSYVRQLETKIVNAVLSAAKKLRPARFGVVSQSSKRIRNRHSRRPDRPVDDQMIVLRIEDLNRRPIAHLVNFAAHPTMHPARLRKFSADYPGAMAGLVEKETGVPCLFLQGAAGDLSANPGRAKGPKEFGEFVARDVLAASKKIKCRFGKATSFKAKQRSFRFGMRYDLTNPFIKSAFALAFFKELVEFYEREYREGVRPQLTTAVLDGRIGIVGVSGEFFCGHALSLKKRARLDHVLFLGYCNDYQQYFPTIQAVSEGGYGTGPEVAPAEIGAGERMMDRALIDLYQLRGKIVKVKNSSK